MTTKRLRRLCDDAGLQLRAESGSNTIQEFLDASRGARQAGDGNSFGCAVAAVNIFGGAGGGGGGFSAGVSGCGDGTVSDMVSAKNDHVDGGDGRGDGDGGDDAGDVGAGGKRKDLVAQDWCDMMFVYSPVLGWVYLHHVTKAAVTIVQEIVA